MAAARVNRAATDMSFAASLTALSGIIRADCLGKAVEGQRELVLKEAGKASKGRLDKVFIVNFQSPMVVVFPEKAKGDLLPFLKDGACQKVADAIVFTKFNGMPYILVCELKCGDAKGAKRQLLNTGLIAGFIREMAEKTTDFKMEAWSMRYVLITNRTLKKQKTRRENLVSGSEPYRPKEISVSNGAKIQLGRLCE
jgi:hypothetical protein